MIIPYSIHQQILLSLPSEYLLHLFPNTSPVTAWSKLFSSLARTIVKAS